MICKESNKEMDIQLRMQKAIRSEIERSNWDTEKLAEKLGLLPSGVEILLKRQYWTFETMFRVAEANGLGIDFTINGRGFIE